MSSRVLLSSVALLCLTACGNQANDTAPPEDIAPPDLPPAVTITETPNRNAYFGDLHVHTRNSFDAYVFNTRVTPDDAYRFAQGKAIRHNGGFDIQLDGPPLDFLAVTDHGEYLGVIVAMDDPGHPLSKTETAQLAFGENALNPAATFARIGLSFVIGEPIPDINDQAYMNSVWADTVAAAERHNDPGTFTTFAGYEFTAMRIIDAEAGAAANIHRNVIFKNEAPEQLFTTLDSINPEDLWDWMDDQRSAGRDALAIPHNSNASNGEMFALETYQGEPLTPDYARQRIANEPLVEITQLKGTSDTHPMFSPNDEWSDFEQYTVFIGSDVASTVNAGDFVRPSLAQGLSIEDETGENPFAFGLIGSSDTHIAAASLDEETHWGKFVTDGVAQGRGSIPPDGQTDWSSDAEDAPQPVRAREFSASGLAGVWATSNTRDALFDAMRRKETFGTTGPRMKVRFFAGMYYTEDLIDAPDLLDQAYARGAPMGGSITQNSGGNSPGFIAWATRDALSAPLDRLQIIKVWADKDGNAQDVVHDVACASGDPNPETQRCPDLPATLDLATCQYDRTNGSADLKAYWQDPDFDTEMDAAYYVRVLEVPTCRWSTWDAVRNGTLPNPDLPASLQERAWSSPIWVHSAGP